MKDVWILPKHAWGGGPPAQPGVEGQRGGGDRLGCRIGIGKYVAGRDAEDGQTMRNKRGITLGVARRSVATIMRLAVDLDS